VRQSHRAEARHAVASCRMAHIGGKQRFGRMYDKQGYRVSAVGAAGVQVMGGGISVRTGNADAGTGQIVIAQKPAHTRFSFSFHRMKAAV